MNFLRTIAPIENDESEFDGDDQGLKKRRSNRKPWRAGLAAQTIVANLEDIKSYKLFERSIVSRINPRSIIELELTYRLASLFWRLRRASAIEVELLQLQAEKRPDAKVQPTLRADIRSRVQSLHDCRHVEYRDHHVPQHRRLNLMVPPRSASFEFFDRSPTCSIVRRSAKPDYGVRPQRSSGCSTRFDVQYHLHAGSIAHRISAGQETR